MFDCFNNYGKALSVSLLQAIYLILWTLLLIVPGIIKAYSYSQTFFIALDKPELGAEECNTAIFGESHYLLFWRYF